MDSTPPSSKRMKTRGVKRVGALKDGFLEKKILKNAYMKEVGRLSTIQSSIHSTD